MSVTGRLSLMAILLALAWSGQAGLAQDEDAPQDAPAEQGDGLDEDELDALFRELEEGATPAEEDAPADGFEDLPEPSATDEVPGDSLPEPEAEAPPGEVEGPMEADGFPDGEAGAGLPDDTGPVPTEPRRQATRLRPGETAEDEAADAATDEEMSKTDSEATGDTRETAEGATAGEEEDAKVMIPREAFIQQPGAELRALDKITGRYVDLSVAAGEPIIFGTLEVTVETCFDTPPELPREASAFVKVKSLRPIAPESMPEDVKARLEGLDEDDPRVKEPVVFSGWMYASSPALNAMEHPVYDIWVISCSAS